MDQIIVYDMLPARPGWRLMDQPTTKRLPNCLRLDAHVLYSKKRLYIFQIMAIVGGVEAFMPYPENKGGSLPETWIVPIHLAIYLVLAACSGYIYFNTGKLELTYRLMIVPIFAVSAMALLD